MANNCKHCFNTHYQPHCHPTTKSLWLCSSVYCGPPHPSRRIMVGGRTRQPKTAARKLLPLCFMFNIFKQVRGCLFGHCNIVAMKTTTELTSIIYSCLLEKKFVNVHGFIGDRKKSASEHSTSQPRQSLLNHGQHILRWAAWNGLTAVRTSELFSRTPETKWSFSIYGFDEETSNAESVLKLIRIH